MQAIFRRKVYITMSVAVLVILFINYSLTGLNLQERQAESFQAKLKQIVQMLEQNQGEIETLRASLNEDYLTRARAFAYIIEKNPNVLKSQEELERIKENLNVDELHVSDSRGIIVYSSVPKYCGLDFHEGKQMREFLQVLDSEDPNVCLIQEAQPNTAEGKIIQYVGVARPDEKGIVQVGLEPTRLLEAERKNTYSYIFSKIPTDIGENLFAINMKTGKFEGHTTQEMIGKNLSELNKEIQELWECQDGKFQKLMGIQKFVVTVGYGDILLGASLPASTLYEPRKSQMILTLAYMVLIGLVVVTVLNQFLKKKIVDKIHIILDDLSSIREGRLDKEVQVGNLPEFESLSAGINGMVESIRSMTDKLRFERDHDALTGLMGYACFRREAERILVNEQGRCQIAAAMVDLDRFKVVNDSYGHDFGDVYLQTVAKILNQNEDAYVLSGRRGGDEFCLLFHGYESREEIRGRMNEVCQKIGATRIRFPDGTEGPMKASLGLAWHEEGMKVDDLMQQADQALYEAKKIRNGVWKEFTPENSEHKEGSVEK